MAKLSLLQDQYLENSLWLKSRGRNGTACWEGGIDIHTGRIQVICTVSLVFKGVRGSVKCVLSLVIWNAENLKCLSLFLSYASIDKRPRSPYFSFSVRNTNLNL